MTEHDQQDFFRELHDKLHDFGAEPPSDAWAGIQSRLPQQKKDRRLFFYLSTAAAILLLGVALLGGFHRFNLPFGKSAAGSAQPVAARAANGSGQAGQAGIVPNEQPGNPGSAGSNNAGVVDAETNAAQATPEGAVANPATGTYASNTSASARKRNALGAPEVSNGLAPAAAPSEYAAATAGKGSRRTARSARAKILGSAAAATASTAARTRTGRLGKEQSVASLGSRTATSRAGSNTFAAASNASASRKLGLTRKSLRRAARPKTGQALASLSEAGTTTNLASAGTGTSGRIKGVSQPLEPTAPGVALTEPDEPEVRRTRRSSRKPQSRRARIIKGLSVEMVAGAAYSYRHLLGDGSKAQRQLTSLERPAVGYSGQLNVAYALNRQAKVSVGLGYSDYATRYRYQVQKSNGNILKVDQRDVYRFMVVPVQLQYKLAGNHRYALGWLAGGTLGVYTGGRTTEGSACNCTQNNDPTTDARYRTWTVAATAGAFVDYNLTPDVRLLLRPTLQYQLTSLTAPNSGLLQRRPMSVGLQTGVSFNLKEPKRPVPAIAKH
ncbi:outer membrane beta-barrel protein [Solirubrum puertoriconensis]|uniref:Outer membrane protein beta-barrel domain-containing protein n=1 Tax=Solirubrum puertoriconensis TaxID=1751427 RepID=A0A9X0HJW1_SOLP1|nr:outer membrane beta-barrel protein [Solirubrum puertoriconensis]KUG07265.1 hypothetical protein ASU33_12920 [Solirubrum puertoriconensis]